MQTYKLVRKPRLTRRASHEMVLLFAKAGNHNKLENFKTDADVKRAFTVNNLDFEKVVEDCRDPKVEVPFFENLMGSTWTLRGVTLSQFDPVTGAQITKAEGPGIYTADGYWAAFELAHEALERAIASRSYREFLSSFVHGVSAIESLLSAQVCEWNRAHPDNALNDSKAAKISFGDKIDLWIPLMAGGKRLDKSGLRWQAFKQILSIRDDVAIHPKSPDHAVKFTEMVELGNLFGPGIGGVLVDLHLIFGKKIPGPIIRCAYAPDLQFVNGGDN